MIIKGINIIYKIKSFSTQVLFHAFICVAGGSMFLIL